MNVWTMSPLFLRAATLLTLLTAARTTAAQNLVVYADKLYTMAGPPIDMGVVVIHDGKIVEVGPAIEIQVPETYEVRQARIVTPGLVDVRATVGLTGILNYDHDQDQLERSSPIQPELRALDAYNIKDELVTWVRSFGVTTVHTGHAPGELISGQTIIVKTAGNTVEQSLLVSPATIACTLSSSARKSGGKSPGTRGKMIAMLRQELIKAREYLAKRKKSDNDKKPARDLKLEALVKVLRGDIPLMVTANRTQDIASALRVAKEFDIRIWLDSAAEAHLMLDEIKAAKIPVLVHPLMYRSWGEYKNMSWETPMMLRDAEVPFAMQSGYESYVPKVRVILFEAAIAAANGLTFEQALASITIDAARILGVDQRVGSLEPGKDGDVALYDGDPFEYTTHCIGTVINGIVVSEVER